MQPERAAKHLCDLERTIREIEEFTTGRNEAAVLGDRGLQLILEREFEILGEALNRLSRDAPEMADRISHAHRIIGMRNVLAHGYDAVDHRILWNAVTSRLPLLKDEVARLLDENLQ
ncbi:MAG: HepT-like ribonuclease domain-containing protein [Verrucomicrobiota bacterium]